jgi:protein TonB
MSDLAKQPLGHFVRFGSSSGLRYERRYDRPVETVWKALTDPVRLADWMGQARVDPYVGGRYELFIDSADPMRGKVVTWQPPQLLEFSWTSPESPASVVRCELVRDGAGTKLIFMHRAIRFARGVFRMNYLKQQKNPLRQAANFWLVLLLHLGFGYLLVTSLGHAVIEVVRGPMDARVIEPTKPLDQPLPISPKLFPPPRDYFPVPDFVIKTGPSVLTQTTDDKPDPVVRKQEDAAPLVPVRKAPVIDAARSCAKPDYPARAIRADWQGVVDLEFLIGLDGRVVDSRIAKSSGHDLLDTAARDALSLCRFTPGTVDGKPEQSWAHLRYNWRLDQ